MASKKIAKLLKTKALLDASHKDRDGEVWTGVVEQFGGRYVRVVRLENNSQRDS